MTGERHRAAQRFDTGTSSSADTDTFDSELLRTERSADWRVSAATPSLLSGSLALCQRHADAIDRRCIRSII